MVVGLAGQTGAGKNYVAERLEELGWRTLDLDIVGHRVLDEMSGEIEKQLGPGILGPEGKVDRRKLGERVFSRPDLLAVLESITYPRIEALTMEWIAESPDIPAAVHAVNLHKVDLYKKLDAILWVHAPRRIRKKRVMARDNRDWKELKGRFEAQKGLNPKLFSTDAEIYSVRNSGNRRSLDRQLERILRRL